MDNGNRILGLTTNSGYTITFNIWGGTPATVMTIGNNYVDIAGYLTVKMSTTSNSQTDYVGVSAWPSSNLEPNNADFNKRLYIMYQTFTGSARDRGGQARDHRRHLRLPERPAVA